MAIKREFNDHNIENLSLKLKQKQFLENTVSVCEECYFLLNDINLLTRSDINAKIKQTQMHIQIV